MSISSLEEKKPWIINPYVYHRAPFSLRFSFSIDSFRHFSIRAEFLQQIAANCTENEEEGLFRPILDYFRTITSRLDTWRCREPTSHPRCSGCNRTRLCRLTTMCLSTKFSSLVQSRFSRLTERKTFLAIAAILWFGSPRDKRSRDGQAEKRRHATIQKNKNEPEKQDETGQGAAKFTGRLRNNACTVSKKATVASSRSTLMSRNESSEGKTASSREN